VAIVARNGTDVAFIPYARNDRILDFSRFDVDGVESVSGKELDAFVFTERGVYRPGDELHVGFIVKQRDWSGRLGGLPVETEVRDARGNSVQVKKIALPESGFGEFSYQSAYESPSGYYQIGVYLVRDGKRSTLLGSTEALVKEFLPDRMKIESSLLQNNKPIGKASGWVDAKAVQAAVSLRNLYGTPATGRRVVGRMVLCPSGFAFDAYKEYTFFDRLRETKRNVHEESVELGEKNTGDDGCVPFDLNLERFADATYAMTFYGEGFEGEGGRSVNTQSQVLVSALPYVVGFKPDSELGYLDMASSHTVEFIAVDRTLKKTAVENVVLKVIEQSYISVLAKRDDGTYGYTSVKKEKVIRTEPVAISAEGLKYTLPTENPGNYFLELREKDADIRLSRLSFQVVGHGAVSRSLDKNAELDVKLSAKQYNAGDEIEISITAPYTTLAEVGSADFFDNAIRGQIDGTRCKRSPGSTLKPFVYALAIDQGLIHPLSILTDAPHSFANYNPENFDREFVGPLRACDALARSRNIPAVALASQLSHPDLFELLKTAGIDLPREKSHYGLTLPLGGAEVTMHDLVRLYGALANEGRIKPIQETLRYHSEPGTRLFSPEAAFLTLEMLGTNEPSSPGERKTNEPIYWKTGTSNGFHDAWTVALFGQYVLAVWIGNFDGRSNPAFVGRSGAAPLAFKVIDALRAEGRIHWTPPFAAAGRQSSPSRVLCDFGTITACWVQGSGRRMVYSWDYADRNLHRTSRSISGRGERLAGDCG